MILSPIKKKLYYPSGKVQLAYNTNKIGNPEGEFIEYYENDSIKGKGIILNDRKEKEWIFYHENGKLKAEGQFIRGYKVGTWNYSINGFPKSFKWDVYKEPNSLFGINLPALWRVQKQQGISFAAFENEVRDNFGTNFNIFQIKCNSTVSKLHLISEFFENQFKNSPRPLQVISEISSKLDINGLDSYYSVMRSTNSSNQPVRFIQFYIGTDLLLFVISFFCLESRFSTFEEISKEIFYSFKSPY